MKFCYLISLLALIVLCSWAIVDAWKTRDEGFVNNKAIIWDQCLLPDETIIREGIFIVGVSSLVIDTIWFGDWSYVEIQKVEWESGTRAVIWDTTWVSKERRVR